MMPLLRVKGISKRYGNHIGCDDVNFDLHAGEVLAVVGESGSGKSTLLQLLATRLATDGGSIEYQVTGRGLVDLASLSEAERRWLLRTDWGYVEQNPRDGLRMNVTAGANVGERLMAVGARHYGEIRNTASDWLQRVELDPARLDELPTGFSGGMQQRLQIARNLVSRPRLIFMDEPTAGLDVSVQARLLELAPRTCYRPWTGRRHCHTRPGGCTPVGASVAGDAQRSRGGNRIDRSGAG